MLTFVDEPTALVLMMNVTLVLPPGTVILLLDDPLFAKTATLPLLLDRLTLMLEGAGAFSVTVAVQVVPPRTVAGLNVRLASAGLTVNTVDFVNPASVPDIVTFMVAPTSAVLMTNGVEVAPPGIVTLLLDDPLLANTATLPLLLLRFRVRPPDGAGAFRVSVPVEVWQPPTTLAELKESEPRAGSSVKEAVLFSDARLAVIVTPDGAPTTDVLMVNGTDVAPAGRVTLLLDEPLFAKTARFPLLEESPTLTLLRGAMKNVTVPVVV